jgi:hypothetical protein
MQTKPISAGFIWIHLACWWKNSANWIQVALEQKRVKTRKNYQNISKKC